MRVTYRLKKVNKYFDTSINISSVKDLESFLKFPSCPLKYKPSDFLHFREKDIPYIKSIVESDAKFDRTGLFENFLFNVFKYRCKNQVEYWLVRGWKKTDGSQKVKEVQSIKGKKGAVSRYSKPSYKESLPQCIEYWRKKGYTDEIAKQKIKERQSTFSLKKCVQKYGKEKGEDRFRDRQVRWLSSLYGKMTEEEKIRFEKSKMVKIGKASKESMKVFSSVINHFKLIPEEYYVGVDGNKEYCLYCKESGKVCFYDFVIPKWKCIIEYHGEAWHSTGKEDWKPLRFVKKSRSQIEEQQKLKRITALKSGFSYLEIWSSQSEDDNVQACISHIEKCR